MEQAIGIVTTNYSCNNMSDLTASRPPAALPVAGRYRMVDFALSNMVNAGIRTVGIILPYDYRSLVDHLGSGKDWSLDRKHGGMFMLPGSPFGTARSGPRFLLRDLIDNKVFLEKERRPYVIVSAANIVYNMDYEALLQAHMASGADITVVTDKTNDENVALTTFRVANNRVEAIGYGAHPGDTAFMDCFVVSIEKLLELLGWYAAEDYIDLFEALKEDLSRVNIQCYEFDGEALPMFSSACYYKRSMRFCEPRVLDAIFNMERPIFTKAHDNPPAKYEPGAQAVRSLVSGGARVAGHIENSILGRDVIVQPGAVVRDSIIMQSCIIEAGARVENAIVDRNNVIPARTEMRGTPEEVFIKGKGYVS